MKLTSENVSISKILIWVCAGLFSITGTILLGITVSKVMRPVFLLRYLYPVSVIAWTVLGVVISRLKGRMLYTIVLIIYLLRVCLPIYEVEYTEEKRKNEKISMTLEATVDKMGQDDVILTDIAGTFIDYYYPEKTKEFINMSKFPELKKGKSYWLIVDSWTDLTELYDMLEKQGCTWEMFMQDGYLGVHQVSVYRITALG